MVRIFFFFFSIEVRAFTVMMLKHSIIFLFLFLWELDIYYIRYLFVFEIYQIWPSLSQNVRYHIHKTSHKAFFLCEKTSNPLNDCINRSWYLNNHISNKIGFWILPYYIAKNKLENMHIAKACKLTNKFKVFLWLVNA